MKQSEMIAWAMRKKKKKVVQKKEETSVSLINKPETSPSVVSKPFEVATMINGKVSTSPHYQSDRTLFNQQGTNRSAKTAKLYRKLKRTTEQEQKPERTEENKYQKLSAIDPTTNKSLKGVRTEFDHIVSLSEMGRAVSAPSEYAPESVHKKFKVREGGTTKLSPEQMTGLYLTKYSQLTSKEVNQAKSNKRLHEYTKKEGWGAKSTYNPQRQAQRYHDSLLEVAKNFGKRGLFSRENAQAYREITGKEPHPLLDGSNPEFSPPSTKQNITGFDAYGDKRRQKAADKHFGEEKAKEAKEIQHKQAVAEYSGPPQQEAKKLKAAKYEGKSAKEIESEKALAKEHGKQLFRLGSMLQPYKPKSVILNRLAPKAKDQSSPKSQPSLQPARHMYNRETAKELKQKDKIKSQKAHIKSIGGKWSNVAGKLPKGSKKSIISGPIWDTKKFDRWRPENRVRLNININ